MKVLQDHGQLSSFDRHVYRVKQAVWRGGLLTLLLWLTVPMAVIAAQPTQRLDFPHHPERILVRLDSGATAQNRSDLHASMGAVLLKEYTIVEGLALVQVPPGTLAQKLFDYQSNPLVLSAEPDYMLSVAAPPPNDQFYCSQWGLNNTGQNINDDCQTCPVVDTCPMDPGIDCADINVACADINVENVWDIWTGDADFKIAVIGTGVDVNHPDLIGNIWTNPGESGLDGNGNPKETNGIDDDGNDYIDDVHGWDFIEGDNDPTDDNDHETFVAGIIGAVGNNGIGVTGINWECDIVVLKVLDVDGNSFMNSVIDAVQYCVDNNITVSNNSYGTFAFSQDHKDAIENDQSIGHIFVAAAGNDGTSNDVIRFYPASYNLPNIIAVAATDNNDNIADFPFGGSNFGLESVDIGAPGLNIYSTNHTPNYRYWSGTSFASPHVAGVVALLRSKMTNLTWNEIIEHIFNNVREVVDLENMTVTGGVIDAAASMVDCNNNGILDETDIANGFSTDCNGNQLADDCETGGTEDCQPNGTFDFCDISTGTSNDCNANQIPDECETGVNEDCQPNGTLDLCDIYIGTALDCNENFVPDSCDIASQTSKDDNFDGIPDECVFLFVSSTAAGTGTGKTWANALTSVAAALTIANKPNSSVEEIWVAGGTYHEAIRLVEDIDVYGGFAGWETNLNERDINANETIISADLADNDAFSFYSDNAPFVVDASNTTDQTLFDGFTLKDARHSVGAAGGGLFCQTCSLIINHCKITGNEASALSRLNFGIYGLQFAPCVFDFHLPINASLRCINIS